MRLSIIAAALPLVFAAPAAEMAPLMVPSGAQIIDGKYIVKFKDGSTIGVMEAAQSTVGKVEHVYEGGFNGIAAEMNAEQLAEMRKNPIVEYIEPDSKVSIDGINRIIEQPGATWGLARLSSRAAGNTSYFHDEVSGRGVCAVIVDTGIAADHPGFGGRATQVQSYIPGQDTDGHGHGTHCAGTIGSEIWGVAKNVALFGVKVLDDSGSGTISDVIAGLQFVLTISAQNFCPKGIVVNLSLGGGYSLALNAAVKMLTGRDIVVVVAAGNSGGDACRVSPASEPSACTVGATDRWDQRPRFSNYGQCVKVHAPGVDITSTWPGGGSNILSGTSMASPHVAGLAAWWMAVGHASPQGVCQVVRQLSTKNIIGSMPSNTENFLAYSAVLELTDH